MMTRQLIGKVKALYRYPVKSMQGEQLESMEFGRNGAIGDRAFSLREGSRRIVSAKRTTSLLDFHARYESGPNSPLIIDLPNGETARTDRPDASGILSNFLKRAVTLEHWQPTQQNFGELDANTIFGDVPIAEALEGKKRQLPADADRYDLAPGTFFDSAHLHLLTTGTLAHLKSLIGEDVELDVRRFRPNIFIETLADQTGFLEDAWLGGQLLINDTLIHDIWPTLRCVMTTLPQCGLPKDPRILRTIVKQHENHLGVFADVGQAGSIRVGDDVFLLQEAA